MRIAVLALTTNSPKVPTDSEKLKTFLKKRIKQIEYIDLSSSDQIHKGDLILGIDGRVEESINIPQSRGTPICGITAEKLFITR